jgi:hypothetical protein
MTMSREEINYVSRLIAIFALVLLVPSACSSNQFNVLGGSTGSAKQTSSDAEAPKSADGDAVDTESAEDPLAGPPQVITGAYLACAPIQPLSDSDAIADDLANKIGNDKSGFGCGFQNEDGTKNSAKVDITEVKVVHADHSQETAVFFPAPEASRWQISFVLPKTKSQDIIAIVVSGTIAGEVFDASTVPLSAANDPGLRDFHLVFVSSAKYVPGAKRDFAGLDGADAKCAQLAQAANLRGESWRAILASTTARISDRINVSKSVKNIAGKTIFDSPQQTSILTSNLLAPVDLDEHNVVIPASGSGDSDLADGVWTGISAGTGGLAKTGETCVNWTSDKESEDGVTGNINAVEISNWLSGGNAKCSLARRLYCISQFDVTRTIFYRSTKLSGLRR